MNLPTEKLSCFAISAPGLEQLTLKELERLEVGDVKLVRGGVEWEGTLRSVYIANLWSRTASRVVIRIGQFYASNFAELERKAKKVDWAHYIGRGRELRFKVTCKKSRLYHSDAVAERFARVIHGIVGPGTSSVIKDIDDETAPSDAQIVLVRIERDQVVVSLDSSGELLHRRGYRKEIAKAPLRETIAAAMVLASGWDMRGPFIDPMCGSGTIPIEAVMIARKMAPGRSRAFGFQSWPGFDSGLWKRCLDDALSGEVPLSGVIVRGSDRDAGAIEAAVSNAKRAGIEGDVDFAIGAISNVEPISERCWIVSNPPYGARIGDSTVRNLYAQMGKVVRECYPAATVGLLSPDRGLDRQLGLKFKTRLTLSNGGIPVQFVQSS